MLKKKKHFQRLDFNHKENFKIKVPLVIFCLQLLCIFKDCQIVLRVYV